MILSNGSELGIARYEEDSLRINSIFSENSQLSNPVWPFYSEAAKSLFFEAREHGAAGIYRADAYTFINKPQILASGRYPSLSPDGQSIAYLNEHNIIVIKDLRSEVELLISETIKRLSVWKRPQWLNNNEIVYVTNNDEVSVYNRNEGSHSILFSERLLPVTSMDGIIMFIDHDAKRLFKYKDGELNIIIKNRFLSMGPGIILFDEGRKFLYSRQTTSEMFRLSERKDTFSFSFDSGEEKKMISGYSLFGGSQLPCDIKWKNQ